MAAIHSYKGATMIPFILLLISMALVGCGGGGAITDGYAKQLPAPNTKVVVIGVSRKNTIKAATAQAAQWLRQRGVVVLERSALPRVLDEQYLRMAYGSDYDADQLRLVGVAGADDVVIVENGTGWVGVRSISVQTGEVLWSGTANGDLAGYDLDMNYETTELTKLALEKAFSQPSNGGHGQTSEQSRLTNRQHETWRELERDAKLRASWCGLGAVAQRKDPALYADLCPNSH